MDPIRQTQTGSQPISINDFTAQNAVGLPAAFENQVEQAAPQVEIPTQDNVAQSSATGRAQSVAAVVHNNHDNAIIQNFIAKKEFGQLRDYLVNNGRNMKGLDLSLTEIRAIAEAFGKGDMTASFPLIGSYTDQDKLAMKLLIEASDININSKLTLLKEFSGDDALFSFARSASLETLEGLSAVNRRNLINVLDPGQGTLATVSSAVTEAYSRRLMGATHQQEDSLVSRLLRSTRNESELRSLLTQVNEFNRDDVVYRFVMDLSPQELSQLSDDLKKDLLSMLVDAGIQLPFFGPGVGSINVDLNAVGNLDETLNMTFDEHAHAARRLYTAMAEGTQQSDEVQNLVQKSDELVNQLQAIEQSLQQDLQNNTISREKIASYLSQVQGLQGQFADRPEARAKVQSLLQTLTQIQENLGTASQLRSQTVSALNQSESALEQTETSISTVQNQLSRLGTELQSLNNQVETAENQLVSQYRQMANIRQQMGQLSEEHQQAFEQMQSILNGQDIGPEGLRELESLNQRMKQLESQLQDPSKSSLFRRVDDLQSTIDQKRAAFNTAIADFNHSRQNLAHQSQRLGQLIERYENQIQTLDAGHAQAQSKLAGLDGTGLTESELAGLRTEVDEARHAIETHRGSLQAIQRTYNNTIVPGAQTALQSGAQLERQSAEIGAQLESLDTQSQVLETAQEQNVQEHQSISVQFKDFFDIYSVIKDMATGGVPNMSPERLAEVRDKIEYLLDKFSMVPVPEVVKARLNELESLLNQIKLTESRIAQTSAVSNQLGTALSELQQRKSAAEQGIQAANSAVETAETRLSEAERSVRESTEKLDKLNTQIAKQEEQLDSFIAQLDSTDASNQASKIEFMQQLKAMRDAQGTGNTESNKPNPNALLETFKANDSNRVAIHEELERLQKSISETRLAMQAENSVLAEHRNHLKTQSEALETARQSVLSHRQELAKIQSENTALLAENEIILNRYQSDVPPSMQDTINELKQAQDKLQGLKNDVDKQLLSAQSSVDSVITAQRKLANTDSTIRAQEDKITQFIQNEISSAHTTGQNVRQKFAAYAQHNDALNSRLNNLLQQVSGTGSTMSIEEFKDEAIKLFMEANDTQSLANMQAIRDIFIRVRSILASTDTLVANSSSTMDRVQGILNEAETALSSFDELMADVTGEVSEMTEQVNQAQDRMLSAQRALLSQRRALGIQSESYQQALSRYEALINQGGNLSPDDITALHHLEAQLGSIEAQLLENNSSLQEDILSLNHLKSRVSIRSQELFNKVLELNQLKENLMRERPQLAASQAMLQQRYDELGAQRNQLAAEIDELRRQANATGNIAEVQDALNTLEGLLAEIDSRRAELGDRLRQSEGLLINIDNTVLRIDTSILAGQNILAQLELLAAKIDDSINQANELLGQSRDVLDQLKRIQTDSQNVKELAEKSGYVSQAPTNNNDNQLSSEDISATDIAAGQELRSKQRFSTKLSDQLTSMWAGRRRAEDSAHQAEFQDKREAFQAVLEQKLSDARRYDTELAEAIRIQQELEHVIEGFVDDAAQGHSAPATLNVLQENLIETQ